MGLLTKGDAKLYREWFRELCKLRGISVKYQFAVYTIETIHSEFNSSYSKAIDMDIIFDTNPRVNTLKKIGWVSESPDDKPYIAYLPYDTPNLNTESIIIIPAEIDESTPNDRVSGNAQEKNKDRMKDRKFKVTSINELIEFPDCWICTLAPVYKTRDVDNDYVESNFNFIKDIREEDSVKLGMV